MKNSNPIKKKISKKDRKVSVSDIKVDEEYSYES